MNGKYGWWQLNFNPFFAIGIWFCIGLGMGFFVGVGW